MADDLTPDQRDLLEIFGISSEEHLQQRKEAVMRYEELTGSRIGKLLALTMWLQQGYNQHGHENILLLRRNDMLHDINMIDMGGVAYTPTGGVLTLTDAEIDEFLFLTQHQYAAYRLPDGRVLDVVPLTYGRARINVSSRLSPLYYEDNY